MSSSISASSSVRYFLHADGTAVSGEQPNQLLEIRLGYSIRLISRSPSPGLPHQILRETPSTPIANALFPLPLRQLQDPSVFQAYVLQSLSSLNLRAASWEIIARRIATFVLHLAGGNSEVDLHVVAVFDYVQMYWLDRMPEPTTVVVLDEAPAPRRGAAERAIEKLREEKLEEIGEELGDCSVCLNELNGEREVIKIPCGHVYHESCIVKWLKSNNSCPLCRRKLEDE